MTNPGKIFEQDFQKSIPKDVYCLRIKDPILQAKDDANPNRYVFGSRNPFDYIIFKSPFMYALELKSTGGTAISFAGVDPMIKQHQIEALQKAEHYFDLVPGFILEFRRTHTVYFVHINAFLAWSSATDVKSINEKTASAIGRVLPSWKVRTRMHYDLSPLLGG